MASNLASISQLLFHATCALLQGAAYCYHGSSYYALLSCKDTDGLKLMHGLLLAKVNFIYGWWLDRALVVTLWIPTHGVN